MNDATDQAKETFRMAVRPIYGITSQGQPDQLGSAVLLDINGLKCMATAAHVIDNNKKYTLHIGGDNRLLALEADFQITEAPEGRRCDDHYDFAVGVLPEAMLGEMTTLKFIAESEVVEAGAGGEKLLYTALGYPNSKNKLPIKKQLTLRGQLYSYSSFSRFNLDLARKLDVIGNEHIFIDHQKYSRDETGQKVLSIAPRGLSGGAIICSADYSDRDVLLGRKQPEPRLAGVTIELHKGHATLLGTRIDVILNAVRPLLGC